MTGRPRIFRRSVPKRGNRRDENEDASASRSARGVLRAAVADGASDSSYAGQWARMLVGAYVDGELTPQQRREPFGAVIETLGRRWDTEMPAPEAWYAAEKRRRGAFATLAAVSLREDGRWHGLAIGDACVFQARDHAVLLSFPITDARRFDSRPALVASARPREWRRAVRTGEWQPGDVFILATDALAAWILQRRGDDESAALSALIGAAKTAAGFSRWVAREREIRALRNDDTTVVVVETAPAVAVPDGKRPLVGVPARSAGARPALRTERRALRRDEDDAVAGGEEDEPGPAAGDEASTDRDGRAEPARPPVAGAAA